MGLIYGYWGSYTPFKKIATIEEGDVNLNTDYNQLIYKYGLDNERRKMEEKQYTGGQLVSTKTKFYSSNYEKESITAGGNTIDRELFYIFAPDGLAAILEKKGSNRVMYYASTDKLGSINLLVKEDGSIAADQSYDAWGRQRNPVDWTFNNLTANIITDRGFTGHEHLNYFSLINMNGRAYDPTIGQFLSPDIFVQEPENSQSFNRFSYCLNNPLKFVDPSGYLIDDYFSFTGKYLYTDNAITHNIRIVDEGTFNLMNEFAAKFNLNEDNKTKLLHEASWLADGMYLSDECAKGILNHYYLEAGYNLNELSGNSIRLAEYRKFDPYLASTDWDKSNNKLIIDFRRGYIGYTVNNVEDYINLFRHERGGHGKDLYKAFAEGKSPLYQEDKDYWNWEKRATLFQIKDASWTNTSSNFKQHIFNEYGSSSNITKPFEREKYFGNFGINMIIIFY